MLLTSFRPRYVVLAFLLVIAFSFQIAISSAVVASWLRLINPSAALIQGSWPTVFTLQVVTPFLCLLFGFYVAAVRIDDRRAWLLLAVLIAFSIAVDGGDVHDSVMSWPAPLNHLALLYRTAGIRGWGICLVFFAIYFPERAAFDVRRPSLKWLLLLPCFCLFVYVLLEVIARNEGGIWTALGEKLRPRYHGASDLLTWIPVVLFCLILGLKFRNVRDPDSRRRLRLLWVGLAISLIPPLAFGTMVHSVLHVTEDAFGGSVMFLFFLPLTFLPVVLAYVTVIEKAMDVRVVVRQGLRYALARRGLVILQLLVSAAVIIVTAVESGQSSLRVRVLITALGLGLIIAINLGGRRLASWIDRRFFRDAYRGEQILARLADKLRSTVDLPTTLSVVRGSIAEALHVNDIEICLKDNGSFQPMAPNARWHCEDEKAVQSLQASGAPAAADTGRLLIPLLCRAEVIGFFSLGERISEAPYSRTDIDLLQSVASQASFAIENNRLFEKVSSEIAEREVIVRELAIARDVQQRLFPQTQPTIPGLVFAAACRPAREVGGDYYDYFAMSSDSLGIAIGDVSGKGVPASLLMASLQASLRGQTLQERLPVHCVMENVNRLVWMTSPSNKYATFFFAHYEPCSRTLTYSNGGHNAPFWIRQTGEIERLEAGGAPVGLFEAAQYTCERIQVSAGDLLVLYTDGISEAMNANDEEWGEDRLAALVRERIHKAPEEILADIFVGADAFAAGEPQHDDMTAMVFSFRG
jgi:phosphoserine phosphatase RsbU/P